MDDWVHIQKDDAHVKRERTKARELRDSGWWKQKLAHGICYYCKQSFSKEELTMDHIIPVSRGGKSSKGNCVTCCKKCNNEKQHLTPAEIVLKKIKSLEK
ncbi:MAG: putative endonuclease protein [uncultured bacterium]|nr:MAG: putative endonuclease protein [uncultured bacterium]